MERGRFEFSFLKRDLPGMDFALDAEMVGKAACPKECFLANIRGGGTVVSFASVTMRKVGRKKKWGGRMLKKRKEKKRRKILRESLVLMHLGRETKGRGGGGQVGYLTGSRGC